jgi:hypothetical protein
MIVFCATVTHLVGLRAERQERLTCAALNCHLTGRQIQMSEIKQAPAKVSDAYAHVVYFTIGTCTDEITQHRETDEIWALLHILFVDQHCSVMLLMRS